MASYVVDASIVIDRLVRGPFTPHARILFAQAKQGDQVLGPEFCLLECTNVVWRHVRFHGLEPQQAKAVIRDLRALPLKRGPMKALLEVALEIGLKHQLAIYDSAYIALAQRSGYPLITADEPQRRAALAEGIPLKPITDFTPQNP